MSEIWIGVWIGVSTSVAISILAFLYKLLGNAIGFSSIPSIRTGLGIAVIGHDKNNQKVKIKIAYAGSSPLIVKGIELTSSLSLASRTERFRAWFQIARGYLTDDWEGLQAVFGQRFIKKEPVCIRKSFNLILGILFSLLVLSQIYSPFGWIMLLLIEPPYIKVKIKSSDINIKDVQSGKNKLLPFLIKPIEEREFLIDYMFAVKSKLFISTKAEYVQDKPKNPLWELPRPGHHVLHGNVKLLIKTQGLLATYRINLGKDKEDFILIPQQDK